MRATLIVIAALACVGLVVHAQTSAPPDKKADASKGKDGDAAKLKGKDSKGKADEPAKELPKAKTTLDKLKVPKGGVVVVVDELLKGMELLPRAVLMRVEEYQALRDEIKALRRQAKAEKKLPAFCKLQGKQDGDVLTLKAEFAFATEEPKTTVFLGLLGAHLTDVGDLDEQMPILSEAAEGFGVRVEKPGDHKLTLNLRVRIDVKKSTAGGTERSVKLGLPGATVTTLQLELPAGVKELQTATANNSNAANVDWKDNIETTKTPGRWHFPIGPADALKLTWKEKPALSGNSPLAKVEGQITVRIDATHANIEATILEDLRPQIKEFKEWQLVLPAQAEVKLAPGVIERVVLDAKTSLHTLRMLEATAERQQVMVSWRVPRPNPGIPLPIGPCAVVGAFLQQGTISVQMPIEASLGQRLVYHRLGEIYQVKSTSDETTFQYSMPGTPDKNAKAAHAKIPLKLEWLYEKDQLETRVDHTVKLKTMAHGWEIDVTTLIKVNALYAKINVIDLRLPLPRSRGLALLGTAAPGLGHPACVPWAGLWNPFGMPWTEIAPEEFPITDDKDNPFLKVAPLDAFGKVRVILERVFAPKEITLKLVKTIQVPAQARRLRLELPRPLNAKNGGAAVYFETDDRAILLSGPPGEEEPVPEKHRFTRNLDAPPATLDLAWQPYEREVAAQAVVDVVVRDHTAQVLQTLSFSHAAGVDARPAQLRLRVPAGIDHVTLVSGGEITNQDHAKQALWIQPAGGNPDRIEVVLGYDVAIPRKKGTTDLAPSWNIPLIWPAGASRKEAKVRVWSSAGGVRIRLAEELMQQGLWKERSTEVVPGKDQFPALVVQAAGAQLPLALAVEDATSTPLAAFLADRGLIQVQKNDDGSQQYRARFLIRKVNAPSVDVELPLPLSLFKDRPVFFLGSQRISDWKTVNAAEKVLRVPLHPELLVLPVILDISYTLPADERNSSWRTILHPPQFHSEVMIGHLGWELSQSSAVIATSLSKQARVDVRWSLQSWLFTPEAVLPEEDARMRKEARDPAPAVFAFAHAGLQPLVIYHLPRSWWLLGWSGLFLVVTLGVYLSPLPRAVFWLCLLGMAGAILTAGVVWPATLPVSLFGLQPGVALLAVFVGIHWFWQERYRRQLVFLPAFSRSKPSSTMVRSGSSKRPREASTVDAPAPPQAGPAPSASSSPAGS